MAIYDGNISYFGSPAAYAQAIISKGNNLSDPVAAAAFKKDYPQYFLGVTAPGATVAGPPAPSSIMPSAANKPTPVLPTQQQATAPKQTSVLPEIQAPIIPSAPKYDPYQRQDMQFTPGFRLGKSGQETIVPTLSAKNQWNEQENQKAVDAYNQYMTIYEPWKVNTQNAWSKYESDLAQRNNELNRQSNMDLAKLPYSSMTAYQQADSDRAGMENQYKYTGLIPSDPSNAASIASFKINQAKQMYDSAKIRGDAAGMAQAHAMAEQARKEAGWSSGGADGSLTDSLMTAAGTPSYSMNKDAADLDYNQNRDKEQFRLTERGQDLGYAGDVMSNETSRENSIRSTSAASERTSSKPDTPAQILNNIYAAKEYYRSGDDYYADVVRNKAAIISAVGKDEYENILTDAEESTGLNWEGKNGWKPGKSIVSPIGKLLSEDENFNSPTSQKTGIDSNIVSVVNSVASKYGVDPALILAIGQHETGWGTLGDGKKGMYTGYGSYDSGSDYSNAGLEKQVEGTAKKLKAWGMTRGNVSLERLRLGNSGALPTGIYATDKNWPNAIWNYYQKYRG